MDQQTGQTNWSEKRVFTTGEAAAICKVSQQTIIRCFDSGRLGGFRVPGSRFRRIPRAELIKFMKANDIPLENLEPGPKRILIVDDDPQVLSLLSDVLTNEPGYEVRTCTMGYDAGMLTESFKPHLILLDYLLPDVNGSVVCKRLREREETRDTRILIVSGVINPDEVDQLMKAGASGFLRKPFDIQVLLSKVRELLTTA